MLHQLEYKRRCDEMKVPQQTPCAEAADGLMVNPAWPPLGVSSLTKILTAAKNVLQEKQHVWYDDFACPSLSQKQMEGQEVVNTAKGHRGYLIRNNSRLYEWAAAHVDNMDISIPELAFAVALCTLLRAAEIFDDQYIMTDGGEHTFYDGTKAHSIILNERAKP
jgi:hypothetical protein